MLTVASASVRKSQYNSSTNHLPWLPCSNMSSSTVKARHYQALANRVKQLQANLRETEDVMEMMAERLQDMARLGINSASQ